jgi:D-arabinose 1-dehydrogenase-like Zn-dependent alcohol dehydrogenase
MCGGATVSDALNAHNVRAYHRIRILGVGGLGHLGFLSSAKMGCCGITHAALDSQQLSVLCSVWFLMSKEQELKYRRVGTDISDIY